MRPPGVARFRRRRSRTSHDHRQSRCDPSKSHAESRPTLRNMFRRVFAFKDVIHSFPLSPPKLIVVLQVRKRRRTWRGELRLIQTFLMEGVFNENHADLSSQASPNSHVGSRLW